MQTMNALEDFLIISQEEPYMLSEIAEEVRRKDLFVELIKGTLLTEVVIKVGSEYDPLKVVFVPKDWKKLGVGNYASVFLHKDFPEWVVKMVVRQKENIHTEAKIYETLGRTDWFSTLIHADEDFLILKRIHGITLYDAVHKGERIPPQVMDDIEEGLAYARERGLNPLDVHGKNVMMNEGRGIIVDVSDFLKTGTDTKWTDLRKGYERFYKKTLYKYPIPVPYFCLDILRYSHRAFRFYKKMKKTK